MIYNLIGSGILVAVGAAGMWAVMEARLMQMRRSRDEWSGLAARASDRATDRLTRIWERDLTIARLSDTVGQLQYKRDKTLEYCKQFRVRGAVVAGILSGEQDQ